MPSTDCFGWLHLTDLHYGLAGQGPLWPNVRAAFFADLRELHERSGPWQAVLFTGDLVQSGKREEFEAMETEVLGRLRRQLETLGSGDAVVLAVPGNHDLVRPDRSKPSAAVRQLLRLSGFAEVDDEFWSDPDGEYRRVVSAALANYQAWWERTSMPPAAAVLPGLLPGDFAATLQAGSRSIGVVGLNTTFLQLAGGNYRGRLAWDLRQLQAACGGDAADWCERHDACLLLTHQGRDWLDPRAGEAYPEINPAGRFAAHLFGHMHETVARSMRQGGGKPIREWQGCSLFGLEKFGEPPRVERRHGYGAGRIDLAARRATIRLFPRKALRDPNGWRFIPDEESCVLMGDGGTAPEPIDGPPMPRRSGRRGRPSAATALQAGAAEQTLVAAFTKAARTRWDIIDLAGLPEDERHLAMQRFLLRQLYLPLRMTIERVPDEQALAALEEHRERRRLTAAGRGATALEDGTGRDLKGELGDERQSLGGWLQCAISCQPAEGGKARAREATASRLVVLGDPGGGKTTLLRWLATAYLMRIARDPDLVHLPDSDTLPAADWLPILIRCRELDRARLGQCNLEELLRQAIARLELPGIRSEAIVGLLRSRVESGSAILLFDGLDEITDPVLRAAFCMRIEGIASGFPRAPIIATSRIVGYREMRRRLGQGFAHASLAELTPGEKDDFVDRWCEVTIVDPARRAGEAGNLRRAIHGTDRIERLTTNPMLLTTMALVHRRVGKLPNRRHKLYWEAVNVLLNWRPEVEDPMDPDEALPQLEYLAYSMCDRGAQRLRRDEVLSLLETMRQDYPNIRPVGRQDPAQFLAQLERRTGLFVEIGEVTRDGRPTPVYEFRHLTFQEYLAALAILDGRFPGHQPGTTLAARVRPLAGRLAEDEDQRELLVAENWREALRLCIASCNDEDVDGALGAILESEHPEEVRPRAILAMLCLCDEPNVGQARAGEILHRFAEQVNEVDPKALKEGGGITRAVADAGTSVWAEPLKRVLATEFLRREGRGRGSLGSLCGRLGARAVQEGEVSLHEWLRTQLKALASQSDVDCVEASLAIMRFAFARDHSRESRPFNAARLANRLLQLLDRGSAVANAAAWALGWLSMSTHEVVWKTSPRHEEAITAYLSSRDPNPDALRFLLWVVKGKRMRRASKACANLLGHADARVRSTAIGTLTVLPIDPGTAGLREEPLRRALGDPDAGVRRTALLSLVSLTGRPPDSVLLSQDLDGVDPGFDPHEVISLERMAEAATRVSWPEQRVRRRYERLSAQYGLHLEWLPGESPREQEAVQGSEGSTDASSARGALRPKRAGASKKRSPRTTV